MRGWTRCSLASNQLFPSISSACHHDPPKINLNSCRLRNFPPIFTSQITAPIRCSTWRRHQEDGQVNWMDRTRLREWTQSKLITTPSSTTGILYGFSTILLKTKTSTSSMPTFSVGTLSSPLKRYPKKAPPVNYPLAAPSWHLLHRQYTRCRQRSRKSASNHSRTSCPPWTSISRWAVFRIRDHRCRSCPRRTEAWMVERRGRTTYHHP